MSLSLAIEDLQTVLEQSRYLDRIDNFPIRPGSRNMTMQIAYGPQTHETRFGKTKVFQNIELKLAIKIKMPPGQLSEITKAIDDEIIKDRRRNGQAQTTILGEEGWVPGEAEGKSATVITREIEVHVYEDQV